MVLNISKEGDSKSSLQILFQCSTTLTVRKFFLMFKWNFLHYDMCLLLLALSLGTTEKSLALSSLLTYQLPTYIDEIPLSLLSSRLKRHPSASPITTDAPVP